MKYIKGNKMKILVLVISLFLMNCDETILKTSVIKVFRKSSYNQLCKYELYISNTFLQNIYIVNDCDVFDVGDTLIFKKINFCFPFPQINLPP